MIRRRLKKGLKKRNWKSWREKKRRSTKCSKFSGTKWFKNG